MDRRRRELLELKAIVLQAISHPLRLAILDVLRRGEQCVCDIARRVGAKRSNVSRHLSVMANAGVLSYRKEGLMVYYRLCCPCILEALECVTRVLREQGDRRRTLLRKL